VTLSENAYAKINLYLHVTGKRADGYHLLDSLVVFSDACDRLDVSDTGAAGLSITGPFSATLASDSNDDNLVIRAAKLHAVASDQAFRKHLVLEKNLPVASGIGGGSSDAAAALRLLNRTGSSTLPIETLLSLGEKLGADVPVCIAQDAARMGGIGEVLTPAPKLPNCGMILINPGKGVSTPEVFRARQGDFTPPPELPAEWSDTISMCADLARTTNDLEEPAGTICPPILDVLAALRSLPGCRLARMSGSGATCFALFDSPDAARHAVTTHRKSLENPGWWVHAGGLAKAI
jgi:4-diphosphocytidyl-2-C-methyl-D-erythritol kinase